MISSIIRVISFFFIPPTIPNFTIKSNLISPSTFMLVGLAPCTLFVLQRSPRDYLILSYTSILNNYSKHLLHHQIYFCIYFPIINSFVNAFCEFLFQSHVIRLLNCLIYLTIRSFSQEKYSIFAYYINYIIYLVNYSCLLIFLIFTL